MQKVTPFLWFDDNAEEAMKFYTSIFKNSKTLGPSRFEIEGAEYIAFNGGPHFKFNEAISLFVRCKDQQEVDYYWQRLSEGGEKSRCGWLKDKFGLSWQVVPDTLGDMLNDEDEERAERVRDAMLKMSKLDIAELQRAYETVPFPSV